MTYRTRKLKNVAVAYWVYLGVFTLIAHFFVGYIPAVHPDQRTLFVDQANPSATLSNNRWNDRDFWFAWTAVFLWAVTFSGALMLAWYDVTWLHVLHVVVTLLVLILYIVAAVFNIIDFTRANDPTVPWTSNRAHDPRYCCIYGASDTTCPNNPSGSVCPIVPAVGDLRVNGDFLVGMWFRIVYVAFLIVALIITMIYIRRAWDAMDERLGDTRVQIIVATEGTPALVPVDNKIEASPPAKLFKGM